MNRALGVAVLALFAACNPASRTGTGGSVVSSEPAPNATPPLVVAPTAQVAPTSSAPPPASATQASPAPRADAQAAGSPSTLLAQCPQKFASARYARCKWSTGPFRRCGGALPIDDDGRPREGCVCNECVGDGDCTDQGRAGSCREFPDDACGPPAKGCVYPGDACFTPSKCKSPDKCMHDALGHPSCSAPPVPHM